MDKELIRLKEVSKSIGLSTSTLRKKIKNNELKGVLIGGNYYVRPNDYYKFIYNIECAKFGIAPEIMDKLIQEERNKRNKELISQIGAGKVDETSQNFIINALSLIK